MDQSFRKSTTFKSTMRQTCKEDMDLLKTFFDVAVK